MHSCKPLIWLFIAFAFSAAFISGIPMFSSDSTRQYPLDTEACSEIIKDLRHSWESPITYLRKRGYIPDVQDVAVKASKAGKHRHNALGQRLDRISYDKYAKITRPMMYKSYGPARNTQTVKVNVATSAPSVANVSVAPTPQPVNNPGFFKNFKDKFKGVFSSQKDAKKAKTLYDEDLPNVLPAKSIVDIPEGSRMSDSFDDHYLEDLELKYGPYRDFNKRQYTFNQNDNEIAPDNMMIYRNRD